MNEDEFIEYIKQYQEPNDDYSFIYLWMHPELELNYLGSSSQHPDHYIGSGTDFREQLKKNPIEEWTRVILAYVPNDQQYEIEELFLKFYNVANNPKFLNRIDTAGGFGIGEENYNFNSGLYVGCPKDREGRKKWLNSLTPEHQEAIISHVSELRKIYYQENKELICSQKKEYYQENKELICSQKKEYYEKNKELICSQYKEYYEKNKEQKKERYQKQTPEQKQKRIDTKRIRRQIIRRIIEIDNTYTKDYFKGMKHEEVLKIEENVKKNIETLERFL